MEEQVLVKAKFKRNIIAYIMLAVGIVASLVILVCLCITYSNGSYYVDYHIGGGNFIKVSVPYTEDYNLFEFLFTVMVFNINAGLSFLFWCPIIFYATAVFLFWEMGKCEMTVTDKRVTGKASFGKAVALPLNQISAIGLGMFNQICVATSSGKVHFWLVENREEVHRVLSEQLARFQATNSTSAASAETAPLSTADALRKYKELLDMGAITQEEFDAMKKELLGL